MRDTDPSYIGFVSAVSGATIMVQLAQSLASGITIIGGRSYKVGQVGSFIRIPQGYQDLFGVVAEVGADAQGPDATSVEGGRKWMRVELVGEAIGVHFERGLSQHPNINDTVHIVTERDLRRIYGDEGTEQVPIGTLSSAESIPVRLSVNALVTRHSAILGSTGSGKSTTVASLLRSIVSGSGNAGPSPAARVLLLDLHGEYTSALSDIAKVFSTAPQPGESQLFVPYWALEARELLEFLTGAVSDAQESALTDKILEMKALSLGRYPLVGLDPQSMTVDSPVPFSLNQLWFDLFDFETKTFSDAARTTPAMEPGGQGDAKTLTPTRYRPASMGTATPFLNNAAKGIRRQLGLMRSRLLDRRYEFLLRPGPWTPDLDGRIQRDLDVLLKGWLGHDKQVTILDLSGVPGSVVSRLVGSILRIVYEALFWSREKTEGGVLRPLLVVMEEAHRYLSGESDKVSLEMVRRIVKEGRKYGVGAMIVSQRPAEIDETILSQCGTLFGLRISNPTDRASVKGALPDNLSGLMDLLPVLRTGEAIVSGEAARLPIRCRVFLPEAAHRPRSNDPDVAAAWSTRRASEGYDRVVASWRAQRPTAVANDPGITRVPITDGSG